ncbi:hypothetical protein P167DRAFT_204936 [Morchella conica CCBAS932]|uniref:Uncharacterized protein n=1 Tax=Morchella conica CCBAS932 TaxID=1392247 RepID=A0A3N4LGH8_9PEZI|nr:hypothetical protein P167DRAFT_204936 [Morchella conica CCBAS932]
MECFTTFLTSALPPEASIEKHRVSMHRYSTRGLGLQLYHIRHAKKSLFPLQGYPMRGSPTIISHQRPARASKNRYAHRRAPPPPIHTFSKSHEALRGLVVWFSLLVA